LLTRFARFKWWLAVLVIAGSVAAVGYNVLATGDSADLVTSAPRTAEAPPLTWAALRNATYPSEHPRSKQAMLRDGLYEEEVAPGSATKLHIQLADIVGFGSLDDDSLPDAAAVLIASPGGSGTFIYLVAVSNSDGTASPLATTLLGDRVAVRAVRIEDRKITVSMRVRGATDPFALLTREVTRTYSLQGNQLVLEGEQAQDVPSAPPAQFTFEPQRMAVDVGRTTSQQGTLRPGELASFLVRGSQGQELRVSARSQFNNAILSIQGLEDTAQLVSRSAYANTWSGPLPATQDYAITVVTLAGNDLNYELSVELRAAPSPAPTATSGPPPSSAVIRPQPAIPNVLTGPFQPPPQQLAALSPAAVSFLETRSPVWGMAVASPQGALLYAQNGDAQLELASAVKVLVALAVMDAAQKEQRYVDRFELSLLWPMITLSDNDSTTKLWDQLGGGRAVAGYLFTIGATGITPYDGPFWGTSTASASSLALIVSRAAFGDLLNAQHRALFLDLLQKVTPSQRWGITAGTESGNSASGIVGLKNGWYPADEGWRINSIGFVVSRDAQQYYSIAVLTNRQPSRMYGIDTIEGAAELVSASFAGD
jgi:hypothetical protein